MFPKFFYNFICVNYTVCIKEFLSVEFIVFNFTFFNYCDKLTIFFLLKKIILNNRFLLDIFGLYTTMVNKVNKKNLKNCATKKTG